VLAQLDVAALALYFSKQEVLGFDGHVAVQRHVALSVQDLMAGHTSTDDASLDGASPSSRKASRGARANMGEF